MKKDRHPQRPPRRRVLARVLAEELHTVRGGMHTFTQCDPNVCDYDLD